MSEIDYGQFAANKPIREITYEVLKDAIISGAILPGERIVENVYAQRYNISRTPIREALRKLEQDGLVLYTARKGVVVRSLEAEDIDEIYIIRKALESLALKYAIERVESEDVADLREILVRIEQSVVDGDIGLASKYSREIHLRIVRMSGMERLSQLVGSLDEYMDRFSYMSLTDEQRRKQSAYEHEQIIDALECRDLPRLLRLSEEHLDGARDNCIKAYEERKTRAEADRAAKNKNPEPGN